MIPRVLKFLVPLAACVLLSVSAQAQDYSAEEYDRLFSRGIEAIKAKRWPEAYDLYLDLWKRHPSHDVSIQLAQVELQLERYVDAATHLERALAEMSIADRGSTVEQYALKMFAFAKEHVAELQIKVNRDDAKVRVGERLIGTSPLGRPVFADPGETTVFADTPDGGAAKRSLPVTAGGKYEVELVLAEPTPPSRAPSSTLVASKPRDEAQPETQLTAGAKGVLIFGGSLALVGLGTGIGFNIAAENSLKEASRQSERLQDDRSACVRNVQPPECGLLQDALSDFDRQRIWEIAGYTTFGVASAVTLTYWLWFAPREPVQQTAVALRLQSNSLVVHGTF